MPIQRRAGIKDSTRDHPGMMSDDNNHQTGDVVSNGIRGYQKISQNSLIRRFRIFAYHTLMPLYLLITSPNLVIILWYTAARADGSFLKMGQQFTSRGFIGGLGELWGEVYIMNTFPLLLIMGYCIWALVMMKILPGKVVEGPITNKGNVPKYKDNGFAYFITTMVAFCILTVVLKQFGHSPTIVYDRFPEVLGTLNAFSLVFCAMLYFKGIYAPSTSDSGSTGNFIFDYYWGTELYPNIMGFDVKVFTNCRFGLMGWALLVSVFALKNYESYGFVDSMFVCTSLQLLYLAKFFWWEAGYMRTIDIMLDRAGFYICWGCLVYVPGLYASVSMYMANHRVILGPSLTAFLFVGGVIALIINYLADIQKQNVRGTNGDCLIWGRKPEIIRARYQLENGEEKESILLVSGWWGLSRHFHYIPELLLAFAWSVPALFNNVMPYSYFIWLLILLTHRSYRDDRKCGKKYGNYWREYCRKVPHRMVPYLF